MINFGLIAATNKIRKLGNFDGVHFMCTGLVLKS